MFSVDKVGEPRHGQGRAKEDVAGRLGRRHQPRHDAVPAADEAEQERFRPAAV